MRGNVASTIIAIQGVSLTKTGIQEYSLNVISSLIELQKDIVCDLWFVLVSLVLIHFVTSRI